jgi:hypothetical protein
MGVIREYGDARTSAPGPIQRQAYSADMLGAAEGRAMEQMGEAVQGTGELIAKRMDQENTSDVTAKLTKANADLAIDLQQRLRTAQPGDKKVFEEYDKKVEETIGAIGDEATTISARNYFSDASTRIKGQLSKVSYDGQAELAGVKAVQDYTSSLNNLSTAAMADPTSTALQKDLHKKTLENLVATGALPREKALQLETEGNKTLAKSTVRGWIELNPEYAKKKLKDGEFDSDLGADGKAQLLGEVDQAVRAKEIEQERRRTQAERADEKAREVTKSKFVAGLVDNSLDTKSILASNLKSNEKEHYLQMIKENSRQEIKTNPATMVDAFRRIHLPDGDPEKIVDETELNQLVINRQLSFTDLNRLRDEMQGTQTEAGKIEADMKKQVMEIAKGKLTRSNPLTGFKDPTGDENMARWSAGFFDNYKAMRAKGKSPQELLNPDSPDYLGKNIVQYVRTPQQIMRDMMPKRAKAPTTLSEVSTGIPSANAAPGVYRAPVAPKMTRNPGESAADFLKRRKAGGG